MSYSASEPLCATKPSQIRLMCALQLTRAEIKLWVDVSETLVVCTPNNVGDF